MPIAVRCACGKEYHFKDEYAGRRAKCPACGQVVRIPGTRPAGRPSPHSPLREDRRSRTRELALLGSAAFVVLVGIGLVVYFLFFSGPAPRAPRPAAPAAVEPSAPSPATQQPSAASQGPAPASGPPAPAAGPAAVEPSAPSPDTQQPSAAASQGPAPASGPPAPAATEVKPPVTAAPATTEAKPPSPAPPVAAASAIAQGGGLEGNEVKVTVTNTLSTAVSFSVGEFANKYTLGGGATMVLNLKPKDDYVVRLRFGDKVGEKDYDSMMLRPAFKGAVWRITEQRIGADSIPDIEWNSDSKTVPETDGASGSD